MHRCSPIVEKHLHDKHAKMKQDPFQFLRGTYYRWAQAWREICPECVAAPPVISVGDLHIDSYGTWRDVEGRLCWGVDDFDEAYPLPYTNDLIRLATSVKIARKLTLLNLKTRDACDAILEGYKEGLREGGCPFVLAEEERHLEKLGIWALKAATAFWEKIEGRPTFRGHLPGEARRPLEQAFPDHNLKYRIIQREAGLGSLGQQRFVAVALCRGGYIAREAKRVVPSASVWLDGRISCGQHYYRKAMDCAVRSRDPYQKISGPWLIRRLSPDSNPIEIEALPAKRDEEVLLHAMGGEAANVHLGEKGRANAILKDLSSRKPGWLRVAAKKMTKQIVREWKEYRN